MEARKNLAKCFAIFQLCGLFHFSIKELSSSNFRSIFYTVTFVINLFIFTIQGVFLCIQISAELIVALNADSILSFIIHQMMYILLVLTLFVAVFQSFLTTQKMRKVFCNFLDISNIYERDFNYIMNYSDFKLQVFRRVFCHIGCLITSQIFVIIIELYLKEENTVVKNCVSTLYSCFLSMIIHKFDFLLSLVNYNLKHLIAILKITIKVERNSNLEGKLRKLWKVYSIIQKNVKMIDESMGITVLIHILCIAISLILNIYYIMLAILNEHSVHIIPGKVQHLSHSIFSYGSFT